MRLYIYINIKIIMFYSLNLLSQEIKPSWKTFIETKIKKKIYAFIDHEKLLTKEFVLIYYTNDFEIDE